MEGASEREHHPGRGLGPPSPEPGDGAVVTVTRIGTQVVVRLSGDVGDAQGARLRAAVDEVADLALNRVVVDLDDVHSVDGAGLDFIATLHQRWQVRLLNTPAGLRGRLPRQAVTPPK